MVGSSRWPTHSESVERAGCGSAGEQRRHELTGAAFRLWEQEVPGGGEESVNEYRKAQELVGPIPLHGLAVTYARMGETDEALRILQELHELSRETYVAPDKFAIIYAALGENDRAFEWLERACEAHCEWKTTQS